MPDETVGLFAADLADYSKRYALPKVSIVLHGGEPLLRGTTFLTGLIGAVRVAMPSTCEVEFSLQTNGYLLSARTCNELHQAGCSISVSLDGDRIAQDRHRRLATGASSHGRVTENLREILSRRDLCCALSGLLAVVDLRDDARATMEYLASFAPMNLDLLLPDGHFDDPPPGLPASDFRTNHVYADWLIQAFDLWFDGGGDAPRVRLFDNIMAMLLGGSSNVEGLGNQSLSCLTIESDGEIRDSDVLALVGPSASSFGSQWLVGGGALSRLVASRDFASQADLYHHASLCGECLECYWLPICGGGLLPHRFRGTTGYANPSIYCGNLRALLAHVRDRLVDDLRSRSDEVTNFMEDPGGFLATWDRPWPDARQSTVVVGPSRNISEDGHLSNPTAPALTPAFPGFLDSLEPGIRELVRVLVHEVGVVTYSSCEGHAGQDGAPVRFRNVGVLPRDAEESRAVLGVLSAATCGTSATVESRHVAGDTGPRPCIDLTLPFHPVRDANRLTQETGIIVRQLREEAQTPGLTWKAGFEHWTRKSIRAAFSDCIDVKIRRTPDSWDVTSRGSFYANEELSTRFQARHGTHLLSSNHAWALLYWCILVPRALRASSKIHIVHLDSHADLQQPRLMPEPDWGTALRDLITGKPVLPADDRSIAAAIASTAIGPGRFLLPFLHWFRSRVASLSVVAPGPRRLAVPTELLRDQLGPLRLASTTIDHFSLPPMSSDDLILLDIDLDFFSNLLRGSTSWRRRPGWHPDAMRQAELKAMVAFLVRSVAALGCPCIVTVAGSPDFCPPDVAHDTYASLVIELGSHLNHPAPAGSHV